MNFLFAAVTLVGPLLFVHAHAAQPAAPKDKKVKTPKVVAAPEIDGASGALAIALAGGGLALLQRSRRKTE